MCVVGGFALNHIRHLGLKHEFWVHALGCLEQSTCSMQTGQAGQHARLCVNPGIRLHERFANANPNMLYALQRSAKCKYNPGAQAVTCSPHGPLVHRGLRIPSGHPSAWKVREVLLSASGPPFPHVPACAGWSCSSLGNQSLGVALRSFSGQSYAYNSSCSCPASSLHGLI